MRAYAQKQQKKRRNLEEFWLCRRSLAEGQSRQRRAAETRPERAIPATTHEGKICS
jgi:hypothetical protein